MHQTGPSFAPAEPNAPAARKGAAVGGQLGGLGPGLGSSHRPAMKLEAEEQPSPRSGDSDPAPRLCAGWARRLPGRVGVVAPAPSGPAAENSSAEAEVLAGGTGCGQRVLLQEGSGREDTGSLWARTELGTFSALQKGREE